MGPVNQYAEALYREVIRKMRAREVEDKLLGRVTTYSGLEATAAYRLGQLEGERLREQEKNEIRDLDGNVLHP